MNEVYGAVRGSHLGDLWLIASGAMRLSSSLGKPVYLSRVAFHENTFEPVPTENFGTLLQQCLAELELAGSHVLLTDEPQNQHQQLDRFFTIPFSAYYCSAPPLPTKKKRVVDPPRKKIAIQLESLTYLDGAYRQPIENWLADYRDCCPELLLDIYRRLLCLQTYSASVVGKHQGPLCNSVNALCESRIFIGIDSGMSHIASSVGVPVYLLEWTHRERPELNVGQWHKQKNIKTFRTFSELEKILRDHDID